MNATLQLVAVLFLAALALPGCSLFKDTPGGKLAIRSQDKNGATLKSGFDTGLYSFDDRNNLCVVLFDGPVENPKQAVTIRLFWSPIAGKTPIDETATNATIHYVIFAGEDSKAVGIYSGAGFVYPKNHAGNDLFHGSVWDANLLLRDSSAGFKDLLGRAKLEGGFTARRDDAQVLDAIRRIDVLVHERLGYPRLVENNAIHGDE